MSAKNGTGVLQNCQYYSWMRQSQVCINTFCSVIIHGHTNSIETWKRTKCVYIVCTAWLYHSMNDIGCQLKKSFSAQSFVMDKHSNCLFPSPTVDDLNNETVFLLEMEDCLAA